jgi:thiamine kinase-like enzyme|tara:strand:- start:107 stop:1129 length:1023 start_codon:yes stop_codon:yes gene_type:complete
MEKKKIKKYFENLKQNQLGLKSKIKVVSVSKLGMGTSNLNYLVKVNQKKFIFRINMNSKNPDKSKKEFKALKIVEKYNIGPKAWILNESKKEFDSDFIIISYIEGKTLNKIKNHLSLKMIKEIAKLSAKIHSIKLDSKTNKLPVLGRDYKVYFDTLDKENLRYIRNHLKNKKFIKILEETRKKLKKEIPFGKHKHPLVLVHGDICEQNMIINKGNYKLIDFESLGLEDPAQDIAGIITDFGKPFNEKQKEIFFEEYLKIRKDKTLKERVKVFVPLRIFSVLLWAITHTLKIKNKHMHLSFTENNNIKKDISYVKIVFKRAIKKGVIDKKYKNFDITNELK